MRLVFLIVFLLSYIIATAQSVVPFQDPEGVLWGLKDTGGNQEVLRPTYEFIYEFHSGLALVRLNGKLGAIDTFGKVKIPLEYTGGAFFSEENKFLFAKGDLWGMVDEQNLTLIPFKFKTISFVKQHNLFVPQDFIDNYYLYNSKGERLTKSTYSYISSIFTNGYAAIRKDNLHGMVDTNGVEVIPPKYHGLLSAEDSLIYMWLNSKCGFVNLRGEEVVSPVYDGAEKFVNGFSRVKKGGKFGFVNKKGKLIIPTEYSLARNFSDGVVILAKEYGKYGALNSKGNLIIQFEYGSISDFENGYARISKNGKQYRIDKMGNLSSLPELRMIKIFKNGNCWVQKNKKNGLMNGENKYIVPLGKYDIGEFKNGYSIIRENGKQGVMDSSGKLAIPVIYKSIKRLHDVPQYVVMDFKDKFGIIDISNKLLVPLKYETIYDLNKRYIGRKTLCAMYDNGRCGLLWSDGETLCEPKYSAIGKNTVWEKRTKVLLGDKWGFVDEDGRETCAPKYTSVDKYRQGLCLVSLNDKWGYVNLAGKEVIPLIYDRAYIFMSGVATVELSGETYKIDVFGKRIR